MGFLARLFHTSSRDSHRPEERRRQDEDDTTSDKERARAGGLNRHVSLRNALPNPAGTALRALKVRSMDMISPRPTIRFEYSKAGEKQAGATPLGKHGRGYAAKHDMVEELADDLGSTDLRVVMERAERRKRQRRASQSQSSHRTTEYERGRRREQNDAEQLRMKRFREDLEAQAIRPATAELIQYLPEEDHEREAPVLTGRRPSTVSTPRAPRSHSSAANVSTTQSSWVQSYVGSDSEAGDDFDEDTPQSVHEANWRDEVLDAHLSNKNGRLLHTPSGPGLSFFPPGERRGDVYYTPMETPAYPSTSLSQKEEYFDAQSSRPKGSAVSVATAEDSIHTFAHSLTPDNQSLAHIDSEGSWLRPSSVARSSLLGSETVPIRDSFERSLHHGSRDLSDLDATYAKLTSQTGELSESSSVVSTPKLEKGVWHESVGRTPTVHHPQRRASVKSREGLLNNLDDAGAFENGHDHSPDSLGQEEAM